MQHCTVSELKFLPDCLPARCLLVCKRRRREREREGGGECSQHGYCLLCPPFREDRLSSRNVASTHLSVTAQSPTSHHLLETRFQAIIIDIVIIVWSLSPRDNHDHINSNTEPTILQQPFMGRSPQTHTHTHAHTHAQKSCLLGAAVFPRKSTTINCAMHLQQQTAHVCLQSLCNNVAHNLLQIPITHQFFPSCGGFF